MVRVQNRLLVLTLLLAACGEDPIFAGSCPAPAFNGVCIDAVKDWADACCLDPAWTLPACGTSTVLDGGEFDGKHIETTEAIEYTENPPMSGPHRAYWPAWGEYTFLPKQRWLHGLEHGGVAILYHPCAPKELVDKLRKYAQMHAPDDGGPLRWMLTPYPDLDSAFSLVTWKHRFKANCFDLASADAFLTAHYRKASEDVPSDGPYSCEWLGRNVTTSISQDATSTTNSRD